MTKKEATKLRKLIREYAYAEVMWSWRGTKMAEDHAALKQTRKECASKLDEHIKLCTKEN